jgi:hypothetical protein
MACGGGFGGHRPPLREVHAMAKVNGKPQRTAMEVAFASLHHDLDGVYEFTRRSRGGHGVLAGLTTKPPRDQLRRPRAMTESER